MLIATFFNVDHLMVASMSLGYSLQFMRLSNATDLHPVEGEWISRVIAVTKDWLCVSLNLEVPEIFHVSVDLLTNTGSTTVYTVDNDLDEPVATEILTVFEVQINAKETNYSQLVVYVSEGTVIRNVDIQNQHCNSAGQLCNLITANC